MKICEKGFIALSDYVIHTIESDHVESPRNFFNKEMILVKIVKVMKEYNGKEEPANVYITEDGRMIVSASKVLAETGNALLAKSEGRAKVRLKQYHSKDGRNYYIFEELSNEKNN